MEKYWRSYFMVLGEPTPSSTYYIERDNCFIRVGDSGVEKHSMNLHELISNVNSTFLQECPKEEVVEALNKVLESLDLPKGITRLTHKL
jgi:hypothetical protein